MARRAEHTTQRSGRARSGYFLLAAVAGSVAETKDGRGELLAPKFIAICSPDLLRLGFA